MRIWTDEECHEFMKQHFSHYYSDWISLRPKLKQWDAIRPCILWIHGGIYLDHDVDCNNGVKFDDWIHVGHEIVVASTSYALSQQDWQSFHGVHTASSTMETLSKQYMEGNRFELLRCATYRPTPAVQHISRICC